MRILHVLWGFSPWREGGLVMYVDNIMQSQAARGHDVAAFFPGRRGLWGESSLAIWSQAGLRRYEIRNPPLVHLGNRGTFPAEKELGEPLSERYFSQTVEEFRPEVIHIHELAGLPFTLIDICKQRCLPLVLTLHDYFPLCPTLNLYRIGSSLCCDITGDGCVECCRQGTDWGLRDRLRTVTTRGGSKWLYSIPLLARYAFDRLLAVKSVRHSEEDMKVIYRDRRSGNIARLRDVDVIIAQSNRTKQIYEERTGLGNIRVVHSSLSHIERLTARRMQTIDLPVRFATLNGALAPYKGAELIRDCVAILRERGYEGKFHLDVFGDVYRPYRRAINASTSVRWRGKYTRDELDWMLNDVDVGIIPSLCEEVYGYVGTEFLAKGIPVIGNRRGGIVDYTIEGFSGWVNKSCTAEELAGIMEQIIVNPNSVVPLNDWILKNRSRLIANGNEHLAMVLHCYEEAIAMQGDNR
ncbi:MAG: glycosyltransferase [Desulfuromonadaceae bacterium]|nr:glycosyltransferase [Desulfuromonadaceae bacterium]